MANEETGQTVMLQLLRARELMQEHIESRRHLEQQAYEALRSWRTTVLIAPVLAAATTALVFAVRLASPNAVFVEIVVPLTNGTTIDMESRLRATGPHTLRRQATARSPAVYHVHPLP